MVLSDMKREKIYAKKSELSYTHLPFQISCETFFHSAFKSDREIEKQTGKHKNMKVIGMSVCVCVRERERELERKQF